MTKRNRVMRDAAIASGAALAGLAFIVASAAVLLNMIGVIQIGLAPVSYEIGKGIDVVHNLVLATAFVLAARAVLGRIDLRERRLAVAAVVAALAFSLWIAAQALYATAQPRLADALVTSYVLGALAASALAGAALVAAVAFAGAASTPPFDQSRRDGLLAWAAGALAVALALLSASAIVYANNVRLLQNGNHGLRLSAAGLAIGAGGSVIGAIAFSVSRRGRRRAAVRWLSRREALLAAALVAFGAGFVVAGIGDVIVAGASGHNSLAPSVITAGHWLDAVSAWILGGCAGLMAAGFLISAGHRAPVPAPAR